MLAFSPSRLDDDPDPHFLVVALSCVCGPVCIGISNMRCIRVCVRVSIEYLGAGLAAENFIVQFVCK